MLRNLLAISVLTLAPAFAQTCGYNVYPLRMVDEFGLPVQTVPDSWGNPVAQFATNEVYLAFDPSMPDGLHRFFVQLTDRDITVVTATDPAADRVVDVLKTGANISLSFPFATSMPELGLGLNGIGQSLKLDFTPLVVNGVTDCHFKAWAGTGWTADPLTGLPVNAASPAMVVPGTYPNCNIASYHHLEIANCGTPPTTICEGHTIGFWRNCHGRQLVTQYGILPTLPALNLVNACGQRVAFSSLTSYTNWLKRARSTNMAYMLSAQLVAMYNNVTVGYASTNCVVHHPSLGNITIGELMARAAASLAANPYTPACHPQRNYQKALKDALDRANNNANWVSL